MPDWGGKYARHDTTSAWIRKALDSWGYPPPVEPERSTCECWKHSAPLCEACQAKQKANAEVKPHGD